MAGSVGFGGAQSAARAQTLPTAQTLLTNLTGARSFTGLGSSLGNSRGDQKSAASKAFSVTVGANAVTITTLDVYLRSRDVQADVITGGVYTDVDNHPGALLVPFAKLSVPATTEKAGSTTTPAVRYTLTIANPQANVTLAPTTRYWFLLSGAVYESGVAANAAPVWSSPLPAAAPSVPAGTLTALTFNEFKSSGNNWASWQSSKSENTIELHGFMGAPTTAASTPARLSSRSMGSATSGLMPAPVGINVSLVHKLIGHSEYVNSVAFSPDGSLIASGGRDKTVRLWDAATGAPRSLLGKHDAFVSSVAFSPDGRSLASGGWDNKIRLFDLTSGDEISEGKFDKNAGYVLSLAFNPNGRRLASGSNDRSARAFSVATGIAETSGPERDAIASVAYSADGSRLAGASLDGSVYIWDAGTMHLLRKLSPGKPGAATTPMLSITFLDDDLVAAGSKNGAVTVWTAGDGAKVATLPAGTGEVYGLAYNARKHLLASGGADKLIRVWTLASIRGATGGSAAPIATAPGHTNTIRSVAFNQSGDLLASGGWDYTVIVWRVNVGQ